MKSLKLPITLFTVSSFIFVLSVLYFGDALPEKLAVHFDAVGHPNGWMSRSEDMLTILLMGFGLTFIVLTLFYSFRFFPASYLSVPNQAFWRHPQNYQTACNYLFRGSFILASNFLIFFTGLHILIIEANLQTTIGLPFPLQYFVIGIFILLQTLWVTDILLYFAKPTPLKNA